MLRNAHELRVYIWSNVCVIGFALLSLIIYDVKDCLTWKFDSVISIRKTGRRIVPWAVSIFLLFIVARSFPDKIYFPSDIFLETRLLHHRCIFHVPYYCFERDNGVQFHETIGNFITSSIRYLSKTERV